jgi:hypothetical protein
MVNVYQRSHNQTPFRPLWILQMISLDFIGPISATSSDKGSPSPPSTPTHISIYDVDTEPRPYDYMKI